MSKSEFKHYNEDIIKTLTHRITSLAVANACMYDYVLSSMPKLSDFRQLQTLLFHHIESKYLENLLDQLPSLPRLSSLTICSDEDVKNKNLIFRRVFSLPALKYCKLSFYTWTAAIPLEVCENEYSPIEHLVIAKSVRYDLLDKLLSYVPQLRRLSIESLTAPWYGQEKVPRISLNCLTHFSLKCDLSFDFLTKLIGDCFRTIQVLHLTLENSSTTTNYIDAYRWEQLIRDHLHGLRVFDIQIKTFINDTDDLLSRETYIDQFTSPFWLERQWYFAHDFCPTKYRKYLLFYSTNPYRYCFFLVLMIIVYI